jgi:hypothetical protein
MAIQKTDNGLLGAYPTEVEVQGDGSLRQVVKVASVGPSASLGGITTVTSEAASASAVILLAANANRVEASITNDSTAVLYILCGSQTPTSSLWTFRLNPYDQVIIDSTPEIIKGIWDSATGSAKVTEVSL